MEFLDRLSAAMEHNNSLVCVGLDSQSDRLPAQLSGPDKVFEFNKAIIDRTADSVCAYKPNSAFYEAGGAKGIEQLKKTCDYIKNHYSEIPIILDAKRGDIGSTNQAYAQFTFDYLGADAVTLHPYLGREALEAFFEYKNKGLVILCRTSNPGAGDLQDLEVGGEKMYEVVARKVRDEWNQAGNCLLVAGATYPAELPQLRALMGDDFTFLVPGIGAQGGNIEQTVKSGRNSRGQGLIINSAREIIFASTGKDFAEAARSKTIELKEKINACRRSR